MTREQVWEAVSTFLRGEFGRLLDVRDVRRVRRVVGEGWTASVVLAAPSGDLHVADVAVDDAGRMTPLLDADAVIAAVKRAQSATALPAAPTDEMGDFGDLGGGDDDDMAGLDVLSAAEDPPELRVARALEKGDAAALREARELLPRLLADPQKRGATLLAMAEVEFKLASPEQGREFLEAAARDFADRFDMTSLERCAALMLSHFGYRAFIGSPVHERLTRCRERLDPAPGLFETRSFAFMPPELRTWIEPHVRVRALGAGETLVAEGEPSREVFVVKSGLLGVWLEKPSGGQWLVRCCYPGWLLGESSVLVDGDPRCTATLRAERASEVWVIPAPIARSAMHNFPAFAGRIASTKQINRIDSFFSMHETMGQLEVQVRDDLLACVQRIERFEADAMLMAAHAVPELAFLVAEGELLLFEPDKDEPATVVAADRFWGLRDSIHQIASGLNVIARAGTTVAFFDAERLRQLCLRSPEHVVAVLERLG